MMDKILRDGISLDKELDTAHIISQPANYDLIILEIYTLLTAICTQIPFINDSSLLMIMGLPFLVFIPGYALMATVFPRKGEVGNLERVCLSVALSLLLSFIFGSALNQFLRWNGDLVLLLFFLLFLSLVLCFLAYHNRLKQPENQRFQVPKVTGSRRMLSYILIAILILAAVITVYLVLVPPAGEKYTEFYILGPDGKATYATNLSYGENSSLIIGIVNHEDSQTSYRLLVRVESSVLLDQTVTLNDGEKREIPFTFTAATNGTREMEFLLYKLPSNQTEPYRSLRLWYQVG